MSTEPRTVHVNVLVTKAIEIDEPDWCRGHADDPGQHKVDISHDGPEHVIAPGGYDMFRAFVSQAPYSSADRTTALYIEADIEPAAYTPDEVEEFAAHLTEAAEQLRALGRQLARILDGGSE
ncbi:hypothetical protein ABZX77_17825 [Streptomyces sp. NPDC004237]|uniref:DUF6907 domain-containing protein n=1 Tax=Streptomyces sp. NPDC004237 TaxID=3154455 RepID=UPI0033AE99E4